MGELFDQGVANVVGLETFRHGTNPISWASIHVFGAVPAMGGSSVGGDYGNGFDYQNRGRFYFAKVPPRYENVDMFKRSYMPRILPKAYAISSSFNLLNNMHLPTPIAAVAGGIIGSLTPVVKFRFSDHQIEQMIPDRTLENGLACSTDEWKTPLNIGIVGTFWQTLTYRTPIRMFNHPIRVITGVAQLALCGVAIYFAAQYLLPVLIAHKVAVVAGLALAII